MPLILTPEQSFYLSTPFPCPYIPAQMERKLFTRLSPENAPVNAGVNATLCQAGFRRSHDIVYRPACVTCNACVPVRIPVAAFTPSRSLRRIAVRNRDLSWHQTTPTPSPELFALFTAYQTARHQDGEMAQMSADDFAAMLQDGQADTRLYLLRDANGVVQGCLIADAVGDGFSAVYSFFAPDHPRRSLGTALILALIAEAQRNALPYVYLGYWIAASRKMAYKKRFQPLEHLTAQGWQALT